MVSLEAMKVPIFIFSVVAGFAFFSQGLAPAQAADAPFADPVAYCQGVGNVDAPDARYTGPKVPDWKIGRASCRERV